MAEVNIDDLIGKYSNVSGERDIEDILQNLGQVPAAQSLSWSDVPGKALANLPGSTYELGKGVVHAVTHPVQTASNLLDVGAGALRNITPQAISDLIDRADFNTQAAKRASSAADQLGAMFKSRYGSSEGFKQALANDPAGVIADAAAVVAPFEAGAKLATAPIRASGKVGTSLLGETTGVGGETVARAFKAGQQGDSSFWKNLTGQVPMTDVLDTAKQNLQNLKIEKNKQYRSGMVDIKGDKNVLDFADVDAALNELKSASSYKGKIINPKAHDLYEKLASDVEAWKRSNPSEFHTPEGFDALKQKIGNEIDSLPYEEKKARSFGHSVYNKVKDTINKQAPTYASVMKDYAEAADQIREVERALSLKDTASADTAMRKLQSLTRNNVNTNYGNRVELAKQLEEQGGLPFMNALAGQAMSSLPPRGLAGKAGGLGTLGAAYLYNPAALTLLPVQSPAAVGATMYGAGKLSSKIPLTTRQAMPLSSLLPKVNTQEQ